MQLDIEKEAARLGRMTAGQLRECYVKVVGEETRSRRKIYLIRRIIWRLQARALALLRIHCVLPPEM